MSIPFQLLIPQELYDRMVAHARAELPNECCGLLAGPALESNEADRLVRTAAVYYPLVNQAATPFEYLSDSQSMFQAVRSLYQSNREILAIYHSHPSSDPLPSRVDLEKNSSNGVIHLILSLKRKDPVLRGWWLSEDHFSEADWRLLPAGDRS